jgi:putative transposase
LTILYCSTDCLCRRGAAVQNLSHSASFQAWENNAPSKSGIKHKGSFSFSGWVYRQRNLVERFFNRIKHFRGIATRYDKRPDNYLAAVKLVAARIWCQSL